MADDLPLTSPAWTPLPGPAAASSPSSLRWAVRLPPGTPSPAQIALATAALPDPAARAAVAAFLRPADRARSLASRLLQAAAPAAALPGVGWGAAPLARTAKGGKPFLDFNNSAWAAPPRLPAWRAAAAPNWNFNVSHDGAWAALAADPSALVGVDVAAPPVERAGGSFARLRGLTELRADFGGCLAPSEWAAVERAGAGAGAAGGAAARLAAEDSAFRAHWALKEAYTKARGDGLGCDFGGVVFEGVVVAGAADAGREGGGGGGSGAGVPGWAAAPLAPPTLLPSRPTLPAHPAWAFELHALDGPGGHILALARGPAAQAVDEGGALARTFLAPGAACLSPDRLPFTPLAMRDLLPDGARGAYDAAGGE